MKSTRNGFKEIPLSSKLPAPDLLHATNITYRS